MTETTSIFQGDLAKWNVGHKLDDGSLATLDANYTCVIKVAGTTIERPVTDKNADDTRFIAALTPTETNGLDVGQYVVAIEIENTSLTPALRIETHIILTVNEQVVGADTNPDAVESDVDRLTREIAEAKSQRALVASGKAVIDAWRDGRRIRRHIPTMSELEEHIRQLEGELYQAQVDAGTSATPRRTAIGTDYC